MNETERESKRDAIRSLEKSAEGHAMMRDTFTLDGLGVSARLEEMRRARCIAAADELRAELARDEESAEVAAGQAMMF